jgi:uncharacterized protein YggT (Ycf19 family)
VSARAVAALVVVGLYLVWFVTRLCLFWFVTRHVVGKVTNTAPIVSDVESVEDGEVTA